ncbi:MAG: hypothetical protein KIT22_08775 [Verrucomicrobiae bacterium]|nr:hypothetical protein [Verrucomicrobiae bacterium]
MTCRFDKFYGLQPRTFAGLPLPQYAWENPYLALTLFRNGSHRFASGYPYRAIMSDWDDAAAGG